MGLELLLASPIISIAVFCVLAILVDAVNLENKKTGFIFAIFALLVTGGLAAYTLSLPAELLNSIDKTTSITRGMIVFGSYAAYLDIVFCIAGILTFLAAKPYFHRENLETNELYNLILYSISGMMMISHAGNLLALFVGIEIMSVAFYILAGYFRTHTQSVEAGVKYFLLGAFSTGFLVYGMAMIYGSTGSMDLNTISLMISANQFQHTYYLIGFGLMIVGLSFKMAAFPFHQWAPDVYSGSPTVITAFMSTAGKAAAAISFVIISKALIPTEIMTDNLNEMVGKSRDVIAVISALTMVVGNVTALAQKNLKRMLAYSSVAHAGYMLMGIVGGNVNGWNGILFYSTAYMFMQIGSFIVLSVIERNTDKNLEIEDYVGLSKRQPMLAAMMAIFMFSLAGIPPFAGFFGKYLLFYSAVQSGYTWLTIVAVFSSIVSMYFYIGLVMNMYFKEPNETELEVNYGTAKITLYITTIAVIILGLFPSLIENLFSKFN